MLQNKLSQITIINSILICLLAVFIAFNIKNSDRSIVCADNNKLFEGFNMTKEMKQVGEKEFNSRKLVLDTLYTKLQSQTLSKESKKNLMQQFIQGKEELEQFNQNFASQESSKIWSRINGYVDTFSKENKYKLVIGSENRQSVLYSSDEVNVTDELLLYINKKYEGNK